MLTSDLNLSKNCKRIEILKCVLRTFIIIIIIIIINCETKRLTFRNNIHHNHTNLSALSLLV